MACCFWRKAHACVLYLVIWHFSKNNHCLKAVCVISFCLCNLAFFNMSFISCLQHLLLSVYFYFYLACSFVHCSSFTHLSANMPLLYQRCNWSQIYSSTKNGTSFLTLLNNYKRLIRLKSTATQGFILLSFLLLSALVRRRYTLWCPFMEALCTQHSRCMHKIILPKRKISKDH